MEYLVLNKREKNKSNNARRKGGLVPGVIYGKNIGNYLFEVGDLELNKEINQVGEYGIINVDANGSKVKALIKEVQREPVYHNIIHIDLQEIKEDSTIQTEVPIVFHNEELVSKEGGILQKEKNSIKVQCNAENLPKSIDIDLSGLSVGSVLRMADVELSSELAIAEDLDTVIVTVTYANADMSNDEEEQEENIDIKEEKLE